MLGRCEVATGENQLSNMFTFMAGGSWGQCVDFE